MLEKVKMALRISGEDFDSQIADLIESGKADLQSIGINPDDSKPLIAQAITLYCRLYFGEPDDFDRLRSAYDELRGQLQFSSAHRTEAYDG